MNNIEICKNGTLKSNESPVLSGLIRIFFRKTLFYLSAPVYFGRHPSNVPPRSLIFFPCLENMLFCGLAGIVSFKKEKKTAFAPDISEIERNIERIEARSFDLCEKNNLSVPDEYLCGEKALKLLLERAGEFKRDEPFFEFFNKSSLQQKIAQLSERAKRIADSESAVLSGRMGSLEPASVEIILKRIEYLKDIAWIFSNEVGLNLVKTRELLGSNGKNPSFQTIALYKKINAVLNSIDRLEVRGRDSAGISLMFVLDKSQYSVFEKLLAKENLTETLISRTNREILLNGGITAGRTKDKNGNLLFSIAFVYKIAAEIGSLGDNIAFLRKQIKEDRILGILSSCSFYCNTVSSHTRWASVGAITEPNCHPVDGSGGAGCGIIHVCLNGDIDNFIKLKKEYESEGGIINSEITTDTKIIPIRIEKYLKSGFDVEESFRLAVNDFEGSHAISMHTDLEPGKIFLAQRGSGQAVFIGIGKDHYMPASEVYGFIEETPYYLKLEGDRVKDGSNGNPGGQICILNPASEGGVSGIKALSYDGTRVPLHDKDIKYTGITSRDIDRQNYPHYFLKEISESPSSVEKTLQNRWKAGDDGTRYSVYLSSREFPESIKNAFAKKEIRRILFTGQGTAGVAALVCSDILNYYINDPSIHVGAHKASELSGFMLGGGENENIMSDTLVVAISQSGTTTDTNRTVDMVKKRGAHTIAIVNRRDSDITFKTDGVLYTSSGRDIEMSVASTKAFYCQIIAGAVLGLFIAGATGRRSHNFISDEIKSLLEIPLLMKKVLSQRERIGESARRLAVTKTYWASVGSGPNKASADEIRIKLSELCYKTISSDYVEDKKHIDLSSEPLIIVCAAGTGGSVIGDIIKDTAIFKAHKAAPVVIADEGEERFANYAEDVIHVPQTSQHLAPLLNTLAGHLWGYYAALSINESSGFLYRFREEIRGTVEERLGKGVDIYELILEKPFREIIARFYNEFARKKAEKRFPSILGIDAASNLILLCKYLVGKLPPSDFELDFGIKGTALNMVDTLLNTLGESINRTARPIDAIKHQAKTVTVGTSRISEKPTGILFDALYGNNLNHSQLTNKNIIVLKNLQEIVSEIKGFILYKISRLNVLGELTDDTAIEVIKKEGSLKPIPSRVETDTRLKGTKKIIVQQGNVYIGKGRKDDRSIIIIPATSSSPSAPNIIEHLLLLNISFRESVPLQVKIKALGGKYDHIKNIVQENSVAWEDGCLDRVAMKDLFGVSAEKIAEYIVSLSK